ncbi:hypothetical protein AMTR_s00028p00139390 [Amborella trichopoda]|uniref:Uncharacterized protein n=1 Tax=Amborella trichopoda TaxID=13333 RepID=W1PTI6_AMBTC|nr:hypothetical protein AMTR_s00028p00139390 [Amborella trichopoda]
MKVGLDGFNTMHGHSKSHCVGYGHKVTRQYQDKVIPYLEDLCIIIVDNVVDGGGAQSHADVENNHCDRDVEVQETWMWEEMIGVVGTG